MVAARPFAPSRPITGFQFAHSPLYGSALPRPSGLGAGERGFGCAPSRGEVRRAAGACSLEQRCQRPGERLAMTTRPIRRDTLGGSGSCPASARDRASTIQDRVSLSGSPADFLGMTREPIWCPQRELLGDLWVLVISHRFERALNTSFPWETRRRSLAVIPAGQSGGAASIMFRRWLRPIGKHFA